MENQPVIEPLVKNEAEKNAELHEVSARCSGVLPNSYHPYRVYGLRWLIRGEGEVYKDFCTAYEHQFNHKLGYIFTHADLDKHIAEYQGILYSMECGEFLAEYLLMARENLADKGYYVSCDYDEEREGWPVYDRPEDPADPADVPCERGTLRFTECGVWEWSSDGYLDAEDEAVIHPDWEMEDSEVLGLLFLWNEGAVKYREKTGLHGETLGRILHDGLGDC